MLTASLLFLAVWFLTDKGLTTALAFLAGILVSLLAGMISLLIAVQGSYRTAFCARYALAPTFHTAYRTASAIGFAVASISLLGIPQYIQLS